MSSVAFTGIVAENTTNVAFALNHKFQLQRGSDVTPIVFVVNDDSSERESLELLIRCKGWQPQTFVSVDEFADHQSTFVPSCLILEVSQDCNFLELQKRFAAERPEMPVIMIASCSNVRMAVEAIKAGAIDFMAKPFVQDLLFSAIQQALERSRVALARQAETRVLKECYATLTPRERQVMALVVSGMLNKETGAELDISERTVKGHRGRMMQKMKANSLAELVKMAARLRVPTLKRSMIPVAAMAV